MSEVGEGKLLSSSVMRGLVVAVLIATGCSGADTSPCQQVVDDLAEHAETRDTSVRADQDPRFVELIREYQLRQCGTDDDLEGVVRN